jgi:hypothetical protein
MIVYLVLYFLEGTPVLRMSREVIHTTLHLLYYNMKRLLINLADTNYMPDFAIFGAHSWIFDCESLPGEERPPFILFHTRSEPATNAFVDAFFRELPKFIGFIHMPYIEALIIIGTLRRWIYKTNSIRISKCSGSW